MQMSRFILYACSFSWSMQVNADVCCDCVYNLCQSRWICVVYDRCQSQGIYVVCTQRINEHMRTYQWRFNILCIKRICTTNEHINEHMRIYQCRMSILCTQRTCHQRTYQSLVRTYQWHMNILCTQRTYQRTCASSCSRFTQINTNVYCCIYEIQIDCIYEIQSVGLFAYVYVLFIGLFSIHADQYECVLWRCLRPLPQRPQESFPGGAQVRQISQKRPIHIKRDLQNRRTQISKDLLTLSRRSGTADKSKETYTYEKSPQKRRKPSNKDFATRATRISSRRRSGTTNKSKEKIRKETDEKDVYICKETYWLFLALSYTEYVKRNL